MHIEIHSERHRDRQKEGQRGRLRETRELGDVEIDWYVGRGEFK